MPPSLRRAVRLMWAGAGLALLGTIVTLVLSGRIKTEVFNAARKNDAIARRSGRTGYTIPQLHTVASVTFAALVAAGIISILLWVWMAWANNRGSGWARIIASVLFALITVEVVLARSRSSVSFLFILLEWVIGLVAIVLLWQRDTTAYIGPA
ncbi:MAG TPA: hypothetical protein VMR00_21670 [Streptosporangiaceae bacterium]|nr:hypothetical protein [Streptosporangiaceae bacterium]